jgi:ABC-type Fe3+/spermidine/putrescine transport system ATPase subunit
MTEIELLGLSKLYGSGPAAARAVDDVNLSIQSGEFFFLLGPSGCGKTTLLRMIAGLVEPTAGKVLLGGRDVTHMPVERRRTAMVFQSYALWPHMTVEENVQFGPKMRGANLSERRERAETNLKRVEMDGFAARKPNQLSGGQQQRVALARALAAEGDCLLLDEPLSNLDARLRLHMRGELRRLVKSTGATAVYVTHDQKEALSMADRIAVMNAGRIVQVGAPQELYDRPRSRFVADFLGEANFIDGKVAAAGPPAKVETPVGVILAAAGEAAAGAAVTCCIRPERLAISTEADSKRVFSGIPATVETSTFLGEVRQYVCRLEDGTPWRVSLLADAAGPLAPGRKVLLQFSPDDVAILTA